MPKIRVVQVRTGGTLADKHIYWCEGCNCLHAMVIQPGRQANGSSWTFEGTLDKPTYSPSQLSTGPFICHTFIREGMVEFLSDCTHRFGGQTRPLPDLPGWAAIADLDGE